MTSCALCRSRSGHATAKPSSPTSADSLAPTTCAPATCAATSQAVPGSPALYRAIRAAPAAEPDTSVKSLCTRFRVGARTVALAIASPEPPPWKPPNKKSLLGLPAIIDALLERQPFISALQV